MMLTLFVGQSEILNLIVQDTIAAQTNKCHVCSKHMLLHMNEGSGRTTLLRHMTEMFETFHVRSFLNLDMFIEEVLPSSLKELHLLEMRIVSKAVFANYFSGIVALDVADLEKCLNDVEYMDAFRRMICGIREHARLIFFLPEKPGARTERVERLLEELCEHYTVNVPACRYTAEDLESILDLILRENGIFPGDRRYPSNALAYIQQHEDELTPYALKCLVRDIKYNALSMEPGEKIVL